MYVKAMWTLTKEYWAASRRVRSKAKVRHFGGPLLSLATATPPKHVLHRAPDPTEGRPKSVSKLRDRRSFFAADQEPLA